MIIDCFAFQWNSISTFKSGYFSFLQNFLLTSSSDSYVKLWTILDQAQPDLVLETLPHFAFSEDYDLDGRTGEHILTAMVRDARCSWDECLPPTCHFYYLLRLCTTDKCFALTSPLAPPRTLTRLQHGAASPITWMRGTLDWAGQPVLVVAHRDSDTLKLYSIPDLAPCGVLTVGMTERAVRCFRHLLPLWPCFICSI